MTARALRYLMRQLIPDYQSGHTLYVRQVKKLFRDGCRWLDAGGGRRIFFDLYDGEHDLVARSRLVVACDIDQESLRDHVSIRHRVCGDLSALPFPSRSFDMVTCGMVVEHMADPLASIQELGRVLDHGGKLLIHTVNLWGYPTLIAQAAKLIPFPLRRWLISRVTTRKEEDIFPTYYRCNTLSTMRRLFHQAGLEVEEACYCHAGILFETLPPLYALELLYLRLTSQEWLQKLRGQLLVTATKR